MVDTKFTIKRILKEIGCAKLALYRVSGAKGGYYVFTYDNGSNIFEQESVLVHRLWHMSLANWVDSGKNFVQRCQQGE